MDNNRDINESRDDPDNNTNTSTNNNTGNNDSNNTTTNTTNTTTNPNRSHRVDMGIFERFIDVLLGPRRNNSHYVTWTQASPPRSTPPSRISNDISEELTNENIRREQEENERQTASTDQPNNSSPPEVPPAANSNPNNNNNNADTPPTNNDTTDADDPNRAIVITVNYVFSDENQPNNPNRAGSLVMSLPNNASNRDPRVIQEFIRLATQLAYTSILNGVHNQKGITLKTFSSFPGIKLQELDESNICSICFEVYEALHVDTEEDNEDETISHKKRRLHDSSTFTTASSTNSRSDTADTENNNNNNNNNNQPVFLAELTEKFNHIPIKMPCGHIFGKDCLCEWLKEHTTCPLCRYKVEETEQTRPVPPQTQEARNFTIFTLPGENSPVTSPTNVTVQNNISNTPSTEQETAPEQPVRLPSPVPATRPASTPPAPTLSPRTTSHPPIRRLLRSAGGGWRESTEPVSANDPLNHVIEYLTRQRTLRTPPSEPLFPTGMTSRRTANGIETRSTDDDIVDGMELRSLFDDSPIPRDDSNSNESRENESDESSNRDNEPSNDSRENEHSHE